VYHAGCIDRAHHLLISGSKIIGGVALGIALAEVLPTSRTNFPELKFFPF
jgi:hypothetical protein